MITEQQINRQLQKTLKTYFSLEKSGRHELALQVLRTGSEIAQLQLTMTRLEKFPPICPICKRRITDKNEQEFLSQIGECMSCDHLRGDIYEIN